MKINAETGSRLRMLLKTTQTMSGGDATGANLQSANYSANHLNQITSRDVPGYVDVLGMGYSTNVVTVNGVNARLVWEEIEKV